jgi:hypothetical protein
MGMTRPAALLKDAGGEQPQQQNGRDPKISTEKAVLECVSRLRRLETRFTNYMIQQGFETEAQRPVFDAGPLGGSSRIVLPSPHCSVTEALSCLPNGYAGSVDLFIGDRKIASLTTER